MRADIFVPTISTDDQVRFYVDELKLFTIAQDYGMGAVLLRHVNEPAFCLQLRPGQKPSSDRALFRISTTDCEAEFARLSRIDFAIGGLESGSDRSQILEYPLGKNFLVVDASGNRFVVAQWHQNAA